MGTQQWSEKFLGILVFASPTGYMLTSFSFSLFILGIFHIFF